MKEMLDARKRGDSAFRDKDFRTAIDNYSQVWIHRTSVCRVPDITLGKSLENRKFPFHYLPGFFMATVLLSLAHSCFCLHIEELDTPLLP